MAYSCSSLLLRRCWRSCRSVNAIYGCNNRFDVRSISYTCCLAKSSQNNPKVDGADLDFFGLEEMENGVTFPRDDKVISSSERRFLNSLVESHAKPRKKFADIPTVVGKIRFDRSPPQTLNHIIPSLQDTSDTDSISKAPKERKKRHQKSSVNHLPTTMSYPDDDGYTRIRQSKTNLKNNIEISGFDDQFFSDASRHVKDTEHKISSSSRDNSGLSFIDNQYFEHNDNTSGNTKSTTVDNLDRTHCKHTKNDMSGEISYVEDQYFGHSLSSFEKPVSSIETPFNNSGKSAVDKTYDESSIFDEQNFDQNSTNFSEKPIDFINKKVTDNAHGGTTFIDEQYFEHILNSNQENRQATSSKKRLTGSRINKRGLKENIQDHSRYLEQQLESDAFTETKNVDFSESHFTADKPVNKRDKTRKKLTRDDQEQKGVSEAESSGAYDLALKFRKQLQLKSNTNVTGAFDPKQYDSQGFRILKNQVPHLENAPSTDVVKVLRQSIIYDNNDIVAINKPYGLSSHGGPGILHSVGGLLDRIIPNTQLYLVHRIDKDTTGVMLLAKNQKMASRLDACFLKKQMQMRFLAITKGIPEMPAGEIDIPIAEGKVGDRVRMCLRPYKSQELKPVLKSRIEGSKAITRYRVLDQGPKCAVLECMPLTAAKYQIRVHLAFALNCPILGDHKHAHLNKMAPMRLHPEMLKRLKIQQSKVRYVPMHLHARSVVVPEFFDGRNLFISAPLPPHFLRNMQDLRMKLPPHS